MILPLSRVGDPWDPGNEERLAPGVKGYAYLRDDGAIYIPLIVAEKEGNGDVGRFLDALPVGVYVVNVTSARLTGMLRRRGFKLAYDTLSDGSKIDTWRKT